MSKPRLYFAHPIVDYDTPREAVALITIERYFPDHEIVNPNHPDHEAAYKARDDFSYWEDLADSCDAVVFMCMPGPDLLIGSGVAKEVEVAMLGRKVPHGHLGGGKPVYEIDRLTFGVYRFLELVPERVMSIENTKLVTKMLRAYRMERAA